MRVLRRIVLSERDACILGSGVHLDKIRVDILVILEEICPELNDMESFIFDILTERSLYHRVDRLKEIFLVEGSMDLSRRHTSQILNEFQGQKLGARVLVEQSFLDGW